MYRTGAPAPSSSTGPNMRSLAQRQVDAKQDYVKMKTEHKKDDYADKKLQKAEKKKTDYEEKLREKAQDKIKKETEKAFKTETNLSKDIEKGKLAPSARSIPPASNSAALYEQYQRTKTEEKIQKQMHKVDEKYTKKIEKKQDKLDEKAAKKVDKFEKKVVKDVDKKEKKLGSATPASSYPSSQAGPRRY